MAMAIMALPDACLGMKDLGVEASHVTLGILVKAGENQSSFDQIHNLDMAQVSIHNIISGWWFGTMEFYDFPYIGNFIIPTDFHIFSEDLKPPTRCYD